MLDTLIIGGGPAGLTAAAELLDARRSVLVLEQSAALCEHLREIQGRILNWPGQAMANGSELQQALATWAAHLPVRLQQHVTQVELAPRRVVVNGETVAARSILIATGVRRAGLDLPASPDISGNPELCVDHFYDQPLAIVGGGDNAVWDALKFAARAPSVAILHRGPRLRARADWVAQLPPNVQVLTETRLREVVLNGDRLKVVRTDKGELAVTRLSIRIGFVPNSELFGGQIDMVRGQIRIGPDGATSCPGVFAAGDVATPGYLRLAAASGQGMLAAAGILGWLRETSQR